MDRAAERLALIECFERDGRPGRVVDVHAWPLTLGRGLSNQVVLDDAYVAAEHARIEPDAQGRLVLTVLDTANGVSVDGHRLAAHAQYPLPDAGALLQLGQTRLRLRLRGEVLAAEKPLPPATASPWWLALPLLALAVAEHALRLDPGADSTAWLPVLAGLPVAVAGWCGLWALLSKVFQHRFDFGGHLRIALPWLLAIELVGVLLPQLAASLAWPALWHLAVPAQVVLGALWLRAHLAHVLPLHRRAVTATVALATLAGSVISLTVIQRSTDSYSRAPYMSTLPLPATRLAGSVAPAVLVEEMSALAEPLARRVQKARADEDEESAAAED